MPQIDVILTYLEDHPGEIPSEAIDAARQEVAEMREQYVEWMKKITAKNDIIVLKELHIRQLSEQVRYAYKQIELLEAK